MEEKEVFAVLSVRIPAAESGGLGHVFQHTKPVWESTTRPAHALRKRNRRRPRYMHLLRLGPFASEKAATAFSSTVRKQHFRKEEKLVAHVRAALTLLSAWQKDVAVKEKEKEEEEIMCFVDDRFLPWARTLTPIPRLPRAVLARKARQLLLQA